MKYQLNNQANKYQLNNEKGKKQKQKSFSQNPCVKIEFSKNTKLRYQS